MTKKEIEEYIDRRADQLARSGEYENYNAIENALRREGYSEARSVLDKEFRRRELNEMCRQARAKKTD